MALYGLDEGNNKVEVYTKAQVLQAIQAAIEAGGVAGIDDAALIVDKIKETRASKTARFWIGTTAQFNALGVETGSYICKIDADFNIYLINDETYLDDIQTALEHAQELLNSYSNMWNLLYPVGAIYLSTVSTSPADLFGGTWEQIKDTFLLSAGDTYEAGATGGAARVSLQEIEMPYHTHTYSGTTGTESATHTHNVGLQLDGAIDTTRTALGTETVSNAGGVVNKATGTESATHTHTYSGTTSGTGGEINGSMRYARPHENMPPYLTVYAWKRTA